MNIFNFKSHCIIETASIIEAMKMINNLSGGALTLFVVNQNNQMVGTLTDGDIRRGLINGFALDDKISNITLKSFNYIDGNPDPKKIKEIKNLGIRLLPTLDENRFISAVYDLKYLENILPLEAVIMAGGRGVRLKPHTDTVPKSMLKVGGKPILERNIDLLIRYGIRKFYISVNYLSEQICEYFGNGENKNIEIQYIFEDKPLGTAGALSLIRDQISTEYFLHMNSDLFTDANIENVFLETIRSSAQIGVLSVPYNINVPYGILEGENNEVHAVREKPTYIHYANAGIYIVKSSLISEIPHNELFHITHLMELAILKQYKIIHTPLTGYWIDIGNLDDYNKAREIAKHILNV
jgi:dTDP-glucose pyrophosphorylase